MIGPVMRVLRVAFIWAATLSMLAIVLRDQTSPYHADDFLISTMTSIAVVVHLVLMGIWTFKWAMDEIEAALGSD